MTDQGATQRSVAVILATDNLPATTKTLNGTTPIPGYSADYNTRYIARLNKHVTQEKKKSETAIRRIQIIQGRLLKARWVPQ